MKIKTLFVVPVLVVAFFLVCSFIPDKAPDTSVIIDHKYTPKFGFSIERVKAQGSQTIYQSVFTAATAGTTSGPLTNIGQAAHVLTATFIDAPSHNCSTSTALMMVRFGASNDNSNWFPIGAPITIPGGSVIKTLSNTTTAFGAYPFVRIEYLSGDDTNCRLQAFYSGSLYPATPNSIQAANSTQFLTFATNVNGAVSATPLISGLGGMEIIIYGISMSSQNAAQTQLYYGSHVTCIAGSDIFQGYLAAGVPWVVPPSTTPFATPTTTGGDVCYVQTGAGVRAYAITYRYE